MDRRLFLTTSSAGLALLPFSSVWAAQPRPSANRMIMPAPKSLKPPIAKRIPFNVSYHGLTVVDPYHWLKDQGYPKVDDKPVLDYLKAENRYFNAVMKPHQGLIKTLFEEMKGRIKDDDASVPAKDGAYLYWWAFAKGAQYRTWWRRPAAGGDNAVVFDEAAEAKGKDYFRLGDLTVSPDGTLAAHSTDTNGSERFTIRVRELTSGKDRADAIAETDGGVTWAEDGSGFFYTIVNKEWRPFQVRFHRLGADPASDPVIYEEKDSGFRVGVGKTQSRAFILIQTGDHITSEVYLIPAKAPLTAPKLVSARVPGRQYSVDEREGLLYIRSNDSHKNFRIATATLDKPDAWKDLIAGSDRVYITGFTSFRDQLVVTERVDGLDQVRVRSYDGAEHYVAFPEASYAAGMGGNPEYALDQLRLSYTSMVTPATVYDYDLAARKLITRKVQDIPSGYDASQYATERLMISARDGTKVPVSVVYKKGFKKDGSQPLHLYGYGAYGIAMQPTFSSSRLSLLDRGFAYAIAHIRGGDEMGYQWYLDGKLEKRTNTFNDFVDAAKALIALGYAATGGISTSGGSAGGSLMGAVLNSNPELWRAAVAHVPFVDILNTMLDKDLPLTPPEWNEWGNPITSKAAFETILSYSPYENVKAQAYPPIMITAGLNDPRVTYWEPAKWAARLRATKTDNNVLLLKTNMGAGHGGKSGRFDRLTEIAEEFAFILAAFGKAGG
jgi:oligopeptidase B